jgi:hypothetical protein
MGVAGGAWVIHSTNNVVPQPKALANAARSAKVRLLFIAASPNGVLMPVSSRQLTGLAHGQSTVPSRV